MPLLKGKEKEKLLNKDYIELIKKEGIPNPKREGKIKLFKDKNGKIKILNNEERIKERYDVEYRDIREEDIKKMKNYHDYNPIAVKGVLDYVERYKIDPCPFMLVRLTIGSFKGNEEYLSRGRPLSIEELKKIVAKYNELKRWDKKIMEYVRGLFLNYEIGEEKGDWHIHNTTLIRLNPIDTIEKTKEEIFTLYQERVGYIRDYWYRMAGRSIGYKGRDIEECERIGREWVNIDCRYPSMPFQYWYENCSADRNNLIDYLLYQCLWEEKTRKYREENKNSVLYYMEI